MQFPIVGIDDGGFKLKEWTETQVYAVFMRGSNLIENILETSIGIDSPDVTSRIIDLLKSAPQIKNLRCIFHRGATIGGIGIIDIHRMYHELDIPIILFQNSKNNGLKLRDLLSKLSNEQLEKYDSLGPQIYLEDLDVYIQSIGISEEDAIKIISSSIASSKVPEALRIAHMIGRSRYRYLIDKHFHE